MKIYKSYYSFFFVFVCAINIWCVQAQTSDSIQFKVTTLNAEWLSCTESGSGPSDDNLQINNIAALIKLLNSDVVALQEVGTSASYVTIDTLVKKLGNEWSGNIVPWYNSNCYQNQGIIYKNSKVQLTGASLITNGGSSYNWSGGRYPVLYQINLIAGNNVVPVSLINIHAKAYGDETSYNRRKAASTSLKALLDGSTYNTKGVILLGDYNDYLSGTQCSVCSPAESPYKNFVDDAVNYKCLTTSLIDSYYNHPVIDNIIISNELSGNYVANSAFRETTATGNILNYYSTTTDHTPVSALFKIPQNTSATNDFHPSVTNVVVYPSPVTDYLYVESADQIKKLEIYSLTGELIVRQQAVLDRMSVSNLSEGVYLVKIYTDKGLITTKIVKD
jgi:hypothetical protein